MFSGIIKKILMKRVCKVDFIKKSSSAWLTRNLKRNFFIPPLPPDKKKINKFYADCLKLGKKPLSNIYTQIKVSGRVYTENDERDIEDVSVHSNFGNFLFWLVMSKKPNIILEIGTAYGYSGSHLLSGLKYCGEGRLFTYEINEEWAKIANENLKVIDQHFNLIVGKFEEKFQHTFPEEQKIDMALIDAVHTPEFVDREISIIRDRVASGGLILVDDINFSPEMKEYWEKLANLHWICSSVVINNRTGILEI